MRFLFVISLLLLAGCSQDKLLSKQDYQASQQAFIKGDAKHALQDFPREKENGDFITTLEQGYLSLIQGKPEIKAMQHQADLLKDRVRYHVSREARTFFYVQTAEDYYASEHEVIWLHLLLSWGYSLQGKYSDGCVEARVADSLLSLPWSPNGHFDDPTMRLFLAGLWSMCGDWSEARVDLRAAWSLDKRLTWANELAQHEQPPAHLFIVLGGPGPQPEWDPDFSANPLRSERHIVFKLRGRKSKLAIIDKHGTIINTHLSPDATHWYTRHLERESELHEMILDSAYGAKISESTVIAGASLLGDIGKGVLYGIGTGAAATLGILSRSGGSTALSTNDLATVLAVGAVIGGASGGIYGAVEGYHNSSEYMKRELDPSTSYRFVRYLPEYLWMGWSEQGISYPLTLQTLSSKETVVQPGVVNATAVSIASLPDNRATSCTYTMGESEITINTKPDADGNCPAQPSSVW